MELNCSPTESILRPPCVTGVHLHHLLCALRYDERSRPGGCPRNLILPSINFCTIAPCPSRTACINRAVSSPVLHRRNYNIQNITITSRLLTMGCGSVIHAYLSSSCRFERLLAPFVLSMSRPPNPWFTQRLTASTGATEEELCTCFCSSTIKPGCSKCSSSLAELVSFPNNPRKA